jgi:hypothetical protein
VNAVATLLILGGTGIVWLLFPNALIGCYRAIIGDSYARLLNPIGLRALGVLFAILFGAILYGLLSK